MAKDMTGAKLKVGDFVHIDMPGHVFGYVKKIEEGGTIIASGLRTEGGQRVDQIKPGMVYVEVMAQNSYDPRNEVCNAILKCVDPEEKNKLKVV
jgi:hypothetical protein